MCQLVLVLLHSTQPVREMKTVDVDHVLMPEGPCESFHAWCKELDTAAPVKVRYPSSTGVREEQGKAKVNSGSTVRNWLKKHRPKHALCSHMTDYCDTCRA